MSNGWKDVSYPWLAHWIILYNGSIWLNMDHRFHSELHHFAPSKSCKGPSQCGPSWSVSSYPLMFSTPWAIDIPINPIIPVHWAHSFMLLLDPGWSWHIMALICMNFRSPVVTQIPKLCIAWNSMKLATTGKRLVRLSFVGDLGIHQCVHSQTIPESPWGAGFNSSCLTINPPKKSKLKPI